MVWRCSLVFRSYSVCTFLVRVCELQSLFGVATQPVLDFDSIGLAAIQRGSNPNGAFALLSGPILHQFGKLAVVADGV